MLIDVEVRHPTNESQWAPLDVQRPFDVDGRLLDEAEAAEQAAGEVALDQVPAGLERPYRKVLIGSVIHELSASRALGFDPPAGWEHVVAWPFDPADGEADPPSLAATAALAGGARLRLQWLWLTGYPRYEESITVIGERGSIRLDMPQPYGPNVPARLTVRGPDGAERIIEDGRQWRDSGFLEELRVFQRAVTGERTAPSGAAQAGADTASLQAFAVRLAHGLGIEIGGEASGRDGTHA